MQKGDASTVPDAMPLEASPSQEPAVPDPGKLYEPVAASPIPAREATANPEDDVPPLKERFLGVVFSPVETFRKLEARWGWGSCWLAIAAVGLVKGVLRVTLHDLTSIHQLQWNRMLERMPEAQRRAFLEAIRDDSVPAKWNALTEKGMEIVGPFLGTLLSIVCVGIVLFVAAMVLGSKKDRELPGLSSPRRIVNAIVLAAHAKMVAIVGYAVLALATLLGNPMAQTNLANATDALANPVLAAALSCFDPIAIWHTVLLGIGLSVVLGVSKGRAIAFTVFTQLGAWLALVGWVAAMSALSQMSPVRMGSGG